MNCRTPVVVTVDHITSVRNELLDEVACTAAVCYRTHVSACEEFAINICFTVTRSTMEILEAVEYDIMVETRVTVLERMSLVES